MVHPALTDATVKSPMRLLADAVRDLLNASPSDAVPGQPAGRLTIERAYLAEVDIDNVRDTMISVVAGESSHQIGTRTRASAKRKVTSQIEILVHRKLDNEPASGDGKTELDDFMDFVERISVALRETAVITDGEGNKHQYEAHEQTEIDEDHLKRNVASIDINVTFMGYV